MERLGDHPLPWNPRQALGRNLFPGPQRLPSPSPHLQKSHPCAQHPEAGVTLTTSDSLHLTPPLLPQKAGAPALLFLKEPPGCRPAWLCHQPRATLAFFLRLAPSFSMPTSPWHDLSPEDHPCQHIYPPFLPAIPSPNAQELSAADSMGNRQTELMSQWRSPSEGGPLLSALGR